MTRPKALVAGNWKMNGLKGAVDEIIKLNDLVGRSDAKCDVLICPPVTLIGSIIQLNLKHVSIGAQDCHVKSIGAHTGDVSAEMLKDLGCTHIIIGHSERRVGHGENNVIVNKKASQAQKFGTTAIICVGETIDEYEAGKTLEVIVSQVKSSIPSNAIVENTIIAYEPLWAIGSGKVPTVGGVEEVHTSISKVLVERFGSEGAKINILYGGSVNASNAHALMSTVNVNGALVGGASLKADDFFNIISVYDQVD
ncbi:MAG: triose-phosphate isomerase [Kordiimonadaceae bacterium]|jgi:triosephosphate isomerase (TIM)|nr:triose-phosphate isomerase [Kordiimonadaceae bacterium]MBT6135354.1 triose-phosphate isomerase [Kordiimonadaceae bacterium]MBT6467428.1 triose-phosphate isomerase [Kordiimonadaceae bacterium]MBT7545149.1 triose-phosphate isomerase [Kordiimonadaceae bacterium]MBT7604783.1 triose-phosphate isomerase [Kordiimonadaceae bacterium]